MKIGVITHWWCFENYGQLLQCYAFQRFLIQHGHQPFLIRYFPGSMYGGRMTFRRLLRKLSSISLILHGIRCRLTGTSRRAASRRIKVERLRDFNGFRSKYLRMTDRIYRSYYELQNADEIDADLYSVGSDVVWKMLPLNDDGKIFFLDFGRKEAKRISYSASFGKAFLSEEYKKFATPLIGNLNKISVRELSGVKLCAEMGRDDVTAVLDPVFLLSGDEWRLMFSAFSPRNGAFGYFLASQAKLPFEEIALVAKSYGCELNVATVYDNLGLPDSVLINPTIPEWVCRVASSKLFFTNSFHGISMAIILHTPFVAFLKEGGAGMDDRIVAVLSRVGLTSRIYTGEKSIKQMVEEPIDWSCVDAKILHEKQISIRFLEDSGI